ncbi:hypothetical protein AX16_005859 [Volvariella volvacea WC 439]|nr:hypothetical protein AX16_005859 [Volvariella volvacea WC 439]
MPRLNAPSPTQSIPNILDTLPPEIWERVFSFACMDGGYTGRSLSMVSKQCYTLSQSSRYRSVALKRARQLVLLVVRLRDFYQNHDEGFSEELEGAAATSSSKHQAIVPRIRHLFIGLGDLFLDLRELNDDDEDEDENYIYPGSQEDECWMSEYPDSDSDSSTEATSDEDNDRDSLEALSVHSAAGLVLEMPGDGEEKAMGEISDEAHIDEDQDDPEVIASDIQADLKWLHSEEAGLHPPISITAQPDIMDEYKIAESQCLQFLRELLYSPFCLDLESLLIFIQFKHPIDLGVFIPPLKKLEALTVYSHRKVFWKDFIDTTPLAPTTQATIASGTPLYPSLRILRILGDWVGFGNPQTVWTNQLLRFLRNHTPQLERLRTPLPLPYAAARVHNIIDPGQLPSKVFDVVVEVHYRETIFGTRAPDQVSGYHTVDQSHKRILIIYPQGWHDLDHWLQDWEEVMGESGDWGGDDSWNGRWTPCTTYEEWEIGNLVNCYAGLKIL